MSYKRVSDIEWRWQGDDKHYGVRLFKETGTLIWSTWIEAEGGAPQFQPGTSQVFESYIGIGAPEGYRPSQELAKEILDQVITLRNQSKKKRDLKRWLQ
jgi:hypothetical protein